MSKKKEPFAVWAAQLVYTFMCGNCKRQWTMSAEVTEEVIAIQEFGDERTEVNAKKPDFLDRKEKIVCPYCAFRQKVK